MRFIKSESERERWKERERERERDLLNSLYDLAYIRGQTVVLSYTAFCLICYSVLRRGLRAVWLVCLLRII